MNFKKLALAATLTIGSSIVHASESATKVESLNIAAFSCSVIYKNTSGENQQRMKFQTGIFASDKAEAMKLCLLQIKAQPMRRGEEHTITAFNQELFGSWASEILDISVDRTEK